jgi:hypothetical protein
LEKRPKDFIEKSIAPVSHPGRGFLFPRTSPKALSPLVILFILIIVIFSFEYSSNI